MRGFFFLFLCLSFNFTYAVQVDLEENKSLSVDYENILFLGHATSFWDGNFKTQAAVQTILTQSLKAGIPVIATAAQHMVDDTALFNLHYFNRNEIDLLVASRAGQHRLEFPKAKNIFIAGGNLGKCLCEGIRDIALGVYSNKDFKEVNLYMIYDGIYDSWPPFAPMKENSVEDFTNRFFVPAFNCPRQNWLSVRRTPMPDASLDLYYNEDFVRTFDLEPRDDSKLTKKFNVFFISSEKFRSHLENLSVR